jgi:triosephosphate isomerase
MYKTDSEAAETSRALVAQVAEINDADIMIAPPFTALSAVAEVVRGTNVSLGAQNLHWEPEGAFTGEISPGMLVAVGCQYVIIGHSERRQFFGETDATVNQRLHATVKNGLIPIVCIGETEAERDNGQTFSVIDKQVEMGLKGVFSNTFEDLVLAYEPVWAIGTGKTATKEQAQEVHQHIRNGLSRDFGEQFAGSVRILYGGSVKPDNISELMAMDDIDGALIGGASLDADSLSQIAHFNRG